MFNWLNFLSYAVITAITPGPNNIMSMSNAGRLGFRKSFPFFYPFSSLSSELCLYQDRYTFFRALCHLIRTAPQCFYTMYSCKYLCFESQEWLISQIRGRTGLFCDGGYLYKIFVGERNALSIVSAINEIWRVHQAGYKLLWAAGLKDCI